MNRVVNRPRSMQIPPCTRSSFLPFQQPVQVNEFNHDLSELPLAMAYVPIQSWGEIYLPCRALARGTLFQQLDLPFWGGNAL